MKKEVDSTKLVSLLALAAGAVAIPQTGYADIIFTDLSSNPAQVGFGGSFSSSYQFSNLPGTAQFGFNAVENRRYTSLGSLTITHRTVYAGKFGGTATAGMQGGPDGIARPQPNGAAWNNAYTLFAKAAVGTAEAYGHKPTNGYNLMYLGWAFADSTQGGELRYGWVEVSLNIGNLGPLNSGPQVTIWGYAYDTTGAQITMGEVPEPAPAALLALGAMMMGAKGLRIWRRNRPAASKS